MQLPYARPRLMELHEQTWLPSIIRQPIQNMLTAVWITPFPIIQSLAPYEAVADTLENMVNAIEQEDRVEGVVNNPMRIVDCCSGAGGPMPAVEKRLK